MNCDKCDGERHDSESDLDRVVFGGIGAYVLCDDCLSDGHSVFEDFL